MICSGCEKTIPFSPAACPFCGRSTNSDQQALVLSFIAFGLCAMAGLFLHHLDIGAAVGIGLAFAIQILHRHLQRPSK
jgi:hypothetical protein